MWLRAAGCPWDYETCFWAAMEDHRDVYIWARMMGCECMAWSWNQAYQRWGYADDTSNIVDM